MEACHHDRSSVWITDDPRKYNAYFSLNIIHFRTRIIGD